MSFFFFIIFDFCVRSSPLSSYILRPPASDRTTILSRFNSFFVPFSLVLHVKPGVHPLPLAVLLTTPSRTPTFIVSIYFPDMPLNFLLSGASGMQSGYTFGCDSNNFLKCNQHTCLLIPLARPGHTPSATPRVSLQGHCFYQKRLSSHPGNSGTI